MDIIKKLWIGLNRTAQTLAGAPLTQGQRLRGQTLVPVAITGFVLALLGSGVTTAGRLR
jgi:hypothetical protein